MYVARACMGGRGWNVGNMKCSQGVACTSYQSYTCKISNACVWGKIGCVYRGGNGIVCVCIKVFYPRFYRTAKLRLTSMVVFRSTSVASLVGPLLVVRTGGGGISGTPAGATDCIPGGAIGGAPAGAGGGPGSDT